MFEAASLSRFLATSNVQRFEDSFSCEGAEDGKSSLQNGFPLCPRASPKARVF